MRCCVIAQNSPSTSFSVSPQSASARVNALRAQIHRAHAVGDLAEIGFGDADDRRCAALQAVHHAASGVNTGIGASSPPGSVHAEFHPHADLHLLGRDILDAAHQAEAFVAVDQRDVERRAFGRMHDGGRIDRAAPLADAPFELVAAGERAEHAREEHRAVRLRAELVGKLAFFEVRNVGRERRRRVVGHAFSPLPNFVALARGATINTRAASMVRMRGAFG